MREYDIPAVVMKEMLIFFQTLPPAAPVKAMNDEQSYISVNGAPSPRVSEKRVRSSTG
jgi:hypothetical protein